MNQRIEELIKETGTDCSGKWMSVDNVGILAMSIINECIDIVKHTPKHCAFTTYDLGTVDCTIEKSVQSIKQHFNIKQ
jgi:hypothetical protein